MMKTYASFEPTRIGEAAMTASRQMWLAGLGAAVVTRDWVKDEAGGMFKTLVKEGTVVESRAIRFVSDRIENSVSVANTVWKETRKTVESTVKQAADTAVGFAQQVLPKSLPKFEFATPVKPVSRSTKARPAKRAAKVAKRTTRAAKTARKAKRG